jgi:hypothetical protein
MSFGELVFLARFIHKSVKVDLTVRLKHNYPRLKQLQKNLEGTRRHLTEADHEKMTGAGWPA